MSGGVAVVSGGTRIRCPKCGGIGQHTKFQRTGDGSALALCRCGAVLRLSRDTWVRLLLRTNDYGGLIRDLFGGVT